MTSAQVNTRIDTLLVYLDNGDGAWVDGVDALVRSIGTLSLVSGVQTLGFPDGSSHFRLPFGSTKRDFVVVTVEQGASQQTPSTLVISHLTEGNQSTLRISRVVGSWDLLSTVDPYA